MTREEIDKYIYKCQYFSGAKKFGLAESGDKE